MLFKTLASFLDDLARGLIGGWRYLAQKSSRRTLELVFVVVTVIFMETMAWVTVALVVYLLLWRAN